MTNTAENCQIAINYKIAETVLPPHIIEILRYFDIQYIDLRLWTEIYKPTLISCFAFKDKHGSYYFDDEKYGISLHITPQHQRCRSCEYTFTYPIAKRLWVNASLDPNVFGVLGRRKAQTYHLW